MPTGQLYCNGIDVTELHLIDVLLRCLLKKSQRLLSKIFSRRISFNFEKKLFFFLLLFTYYLLSDILSKLFRNTKFPRSLLQKSIVFTTCLQHQFYDQVPTLQQ